MDYSHYVCLYVAVDNILAIVYIVNPYVLIASQWLT